MYSGLSESLKEMKCFKLVCGAGNEDAVEVEKLVALYAKAGAKYFDLSAREDVVLAAKKGLARVVSEEHRGEYYFNVSVGMKGDPHVIKSRIDPAKCTKCRDCESVCEQNAIYEQVDSFYINSSRCMGYGSCVKCCPHDAITSYSQTKPLEEILPPLVKLGLDSIEFHVVTEDDESVLQQWDIIRRCFDGLLSICIDRTVLSDTRLVGRIKKMLTGRDPYSVIIQADGAPMSGGDDTPATTLEALACARLVQEQELPVFLLLSGGTNSTTTELAKMFDIKAHGVSIGSFARKLVREYIDRDDFFSNQDIFEKALEKARWLVDKSVRHMGFGALKG